MARDPVSSVADTFDARLASLDLALFDPVGRPGWGGDARSLLALHSALRDVRGSFAYLEIGSYLGSSMQAFIADPSCTSVVSIDPRPEIQLDDRGYGVHYPANTTAHMIECLDRVPGRDLSKLKTFDVDAAAVDPAELPEHPLVCFVDGEHTDVAALSDARFCRRVLPPEGVIVFHDRSVIATAIAQFVKELERGGEPFFGYALPSALFVVEFGRRRLFEHPAIRSRWSPPMAKIWRTAGSSAWRLSLLLSAESYGRRIARGPLKPAVDVVRRRRNGAGGEGQGPTGVIVPLDSSGPRRGRAVRPDQ